MSAVRFRHFVFVSVLFSCLFLYMTSQFASADDSEFSLMDEIKKMRDPFQIPQIKRQIEVHKTELEQYATTEFKFVGVITGLNRLRALIMSPPGKTFIVSENMKIGVQDGIIEKIDSKRMLIKEKFLNELGKTEYIQSEIKLASEQEGKSQNPKPSERGGYGMGPMGSSSLNSGMMGQSVGMGDRRGF